MSLMGPLPLEAPSFKGLWQPFDNIIWSMTLAIIVISSLVLYLVDIMWGKITFIKTALVKDAFEGDISQKAYW